MKTYQTAEDVLAAVRDGSVEFSNYELTPTVNARGFFGNTPLIPVITWSDLPAVDLLLKAGAELDAVCEDGNTPLHHAIKMGEFAIARFLVARGASQAIRNVDGKLARELCWEEEWPGIFGGTRDA